EQPPDHNAGYKDYISHRTIPQRGTSGEALQAEMNFRSVRCAVEQASNCSSMPINHNHRRSAVLVQSMSERDRRIKGTGCRKPNEAALGAAAGDTSRRLVHSGS